MSSQNSSVVGYSQLHCITGAVPKKLQPVETSWSVNCNDKVGNWRANGSRYEEHITFAILQEFQDESVRSDRSLYRELFKRSGLHPTHMERFRKFYAALVRFDITIAQERRRIVTCSVGNWRPNGSRYEEHITFAILQDYQDESLSSDRALCKELFQRSGLHHSHMERFRKFYAALVRFDDTIAHECGRIVSCSINRARCNSVKDQEPDSYQQQGSRGADEPSQQVPINRAHRRHVVKVQELNSVELQADRIDDEPSQPQCPDPRSNHGHPMLMKLAMCPFWKKAFLDAPVSGDVLTNSSYADCAGLGSKQLPNQDDDTCDIPKVNLSQAGRNGVQPQRLSDGCSRPKERMPAKRPRREFPPQPPPPPPPLGRKERRLISAPDPNKHMIDPRGHAMETGWRVNSIACNSKEKLQPSSSVSSIVWNDPPDPMTVNNSTTEEASIKQEDATTVFLEESCWSSETLLDELSKSTDAGGKAVSSAAVGVEAADPLNHEEIVEVKQEDLDDLISVKPELLHSEEDLFPDTALVADGGFEEDHSWCDPDSADILASCPSVSCGEGSSVADNTAKSDLNVETLQVIDKIREGGTPSVFLYNCDLCHYASNGKEKYKKHLIIHQNRPKKFVCPQCEFRSCYSKSLQRHVLTHSTERDKDFCCSYCPYKTDRPGSLRIHRFTHLPNRDKPYSCAHCHFRTAIKSTLSRHVKIHDANREKKFSCTHCMYCTYNEPNLRLHMKIHDSNRPKPFACPQCDFRTDSKYRLRTHLLTREKGNKRLACPLCSFTTNYKCHYKRHHYKKHLLTHDTKAKELVCPQCPYSTHSKGRYQRHLTRHERDRFRFKIEPLN